MPGIEDQLRKLLDPRMLRDLGCTERLAREMAQMQRLAVPDGISSDQFDIEAQMRGLGIVSDIHRLDAERARILAAETFYEQAETLERSLGVPAMSNALARQLSDVHRSIVRSGICNTLESVLAEQQAQLGDLDAEIHRLLTPYQDASFSEEVTGSLARWLQALEIESVGERFAAMEQDIAEMLVGLDSEFFQQLSTSGPWRDLLRAAVILRDPEARESLHRTGLRPAEVIAFQGTPEALWTRFRATLRARLSTGRQDMDREFRACFVGLLVAIIGQADEQLSRIVDGKSLCPKTDPPFLQEPAIGCSHPSKFMEVDGGARIVLRDGPGASRSAIAKLQPGTRVLAVRRMGNWLEVRTWPPGEGELQGWIREAALTPSKDISAGPPPGTRKAKSRADAIDLNVPDVVSEAGSAATRRFEEFFTIQIRNPRTRQAYLRACRMFLGWCHAQALSLATIEAVHVAQWIEELARDKSPSTVKQQLSAIKRFFDFLVSGQVLPVNPAHSVCGPRLSQVQGPTAALALTDLKRLFESFSDEKLPDVRNRAILAVMTYALAQVSAVVELKVGAFERGANGAWLVLRVKRGHAVRVPLNTTVAVWIEDYLEQAGIGTEVDSPMFRSLGKGRGAQQVSDRGISRQDISAMVARTMRAAGLSSRAGCHAFRTTGITLLLSQGMPLEVVAELAGHASVQTTQRYDARSFAALPTRPNGF